MLGVILIPVVNCFHTIHCFPFRLILILIHVLGYSASYLALKRTPVRFFRLSNFIENFSPKYSYPTRRDYLSGMEL